MVQKEHLTQKIVPYFQELMHLLFNIVGKTIYKQ